MDARSRWPAPRRALAVSAMLGACGLTLGCSAERAGVRESEGSTIGVDKNKVPPGQTVPPPSLGVDMGLRTPPIRASDAIS